MGRRRSALRLAELSVLAPQVVAMRAARMALGTDTEGLRRMGNEKVQAYWESMNAMGMQMVRAQQEYAVLAMKQWMTAWTVPWTQLARPMEKVIEQGMIPVGRRVRGNVKRLGGVKRRRRRAW